MKWMSILPVAPCYFRETSDLSMKEKSIFEIVKLGSPILRTKCKPVSQEKLVSTDFQDFLEKLQRTLEQLVGVGLAAPQVGSSLRVFVTQVPKRIAKKYLDCDEDEIKLWINPEIHYLGEASILGTEACFSVPDYLGCVERYERITITAQDRNGKTFSEELSGRNARIVQHEFDHLNGKLFIDNLAQKKLVEDEGSYPEYYEQSSWTKIREENDENEEWLKKYGFVSKKLI
jgi:peptide deformylase